MKVGKLRRLVISTCFVMPIALLQVVYAQDTTAPKSAVSNPSEQPGNTPESSGTGLVEIVVTAQKRSENLQKVPIAVTAIG